MNLLQEQMNYKGCIKGRFTPPLIHLCLGSSNIVEPKQKKNTKIERFNFGIFFVYSSIDSSSLECSSTDFNIMSKKSSFLSGLEK